MAYFSDGFVQPPSSQGCFNWLVQPTTYSNLEIFVSLVIFFFGFGSHGIHHHESPPPFMLKTFSNQLTPWKINMESENSPPGKGKNIFQTIYFEVRFVNLRGCKTNLRLVKSNVLFDPDSDPCVSWFGTPSMWPETKGTALMALTRKQNGEQIHCYVSFPVGSI